MDSRSGYLSRAPCRSISALAPQTISTPSRCSGRREVIRYLPGRCDRGRVCRSPSVSSGAKECILQPGLAHSFVIPAHAPEFVIPAQAGITFWAWFHMESRVRGNDELGLQLRRCRYLFSATARSRYRRASAELLSSASARRKCSIAPLSRESRARATPQFRWASASSGRIASAAS